MKTSSLILDIDDFCVLKGEIVDKILLSSNPDIALVYLYISRKKNDYNEKSALNELNFSKDRLNSCILELLSLNIIKQDDNKKTANAFFEPKPTYTISELKSAKTDEIFAFVCDNTEKVLGRPLTEGYIKTLLYIYDRLKLLPEVIIELISYLKSNQNTFPTKTEIEREAHKWNDIGINSHAQAIDYIKSKYDEKPAVALMAEALCIVNRNLTKTEEHYIINFINLGFSPEVVEFVANGIKDNNGRYSKKHLFNTLLLFKEKNLFTKEQIISDNPKFAKTSQAEALTDDSYEMQAINRRRGGNFE